MLVKYISPSSVELYRGLVEMSGVVYTNDEEKAGLLGYKPFIMTDKPQVSSDCFAYLYYEEDKNAVYGKWKEEKLSEEDL